MSEIKTQELNYHVLLPKIINDNDGYTPSFDAFKICNGNNKETQNMLNFWDQYGFVVVNNCLNDKEIQATMDEGNYVYVNTYITRNIESYYFVIII